MAVAYVLDDLFAEHRPPGPHPERPDRVVAVRDALREAGLEARGARIPTRSARDEELARVHAPGYLSDLERDVPGKSGWLDGDTYFSPGTWKAALAAAGASVDVTRALLTGEHRRGLAIVRPPGHHAEADRAMGFCLLNNVAIAAAAARQEGAARVAIVDWDVHHGNGTQAIFYRDPTVLFLSAHQSPFYPGTGDATEIGAGEGLGATVNVPLPAGCGDAEYRAVFDEVILPALSRFRPDLVLVSAGFDAHVSDPLAGMRLSTGGYRDLARRVVAAADELCEGRIAFVLEGGYDLDGLAGGVTAVFEAVERGAGAEAEPERVSGQASPRARDAIGRTLRALEAAR